MASRFFSRTIFVLPVFGDGLLALIEFVVIGGFGTASHKDRQHEMIPKPTCDDSPIVCFATELLLIAWYGTFAPRGG